MQNKKGVQLALSTVAVVALFLIALVIVGAYFFRGFGTTQVGLSAITGEAKERGDEMDFGHEIEGAAGGGYCTGTPGTCGHFYQAGLNFIGGNCEIDSCSFVGCHPIHSWFVNNPDTDSDCSDRENQGRCVGGGGFCKDSGRYADPISLDCSDFTSHGKELCECAGCFWKSY